MDVETKGMNSFVTEIDKTSEKKLMHGLSQALPQAGFIAEESPDAETKEQFNWVIDPLDGTTNYLHRLPVYSIGGKYGYIRRCKSIFKNYINCI